MQEASRKSQVVAGVLCFLIGGLGAHRFYVGKHLTGLLMLVMMVTYIHMAYQIAFEVNPIVTRHVAFALLPPLMLGGLTAWVMMDLYFIVVGKFTDAQGKALTRWWTI